MNEGNGVSDWEVRVGLGWMEYRMGINSRYHVQGAGIWSSDGERIQRCPPFTGVWTRTGRGRDGLVSLGGTLGLRRRLGGRLGLEGWLRRRLPLKGTLAGNPDRQSPHHSFRLQPLEKFL